ncbi:hypothetical protein BVC80_8687g11 [Macleaya cordata]|uniref:Phosphorelay protein n=1 Tax=Macleaya cordata TaxID=56857 RepID=A0A200QLC0_MACCD|nr:hypothetical protein BVC80_8687g11 [Macleaya cordata]
MDAKSLAKSKRAHSQQHQPKRAHPNPKSKAPVVSTPTEGNQKKPSGKQTKPNSRQFHGSSTGLPSNWDRYEDEFETGSVDPSLSSSGQASDVVKPKSKGADFGYLISEAQSQSSSTLDSFTSFYDALPDFDKAVSSMLSVRGKSVLSWIGDDNFIVDDNATAGYEASSLSMDLHALAAQLEKIDISRRLFIEADLLPSELCAGQSNDTISKEPEQAEKGASANEKTADHMTKVMPSTTTRSYGSSQRHPHKGVGVVIQETKAMSSTSNSNENSVPVKDDSEKLDDTDLSVILDSMKQLEVNSISYSEEKTSKFEASAAEAELDMLLHSLGESNHLDSSNISTKPSFPVANQVNSISFMEGFAAGNASSEPSRQGSKSFSSTVTMTIDIEDTIDDLLSETSNLKNQNDAVLPQEKTTLLSDLPSLSASSSYSGSKVLDDFDSWLDTI